jgi:hypothetical protein
VSDIISFNTRGYQDIIAEQPKEYYTNLTQAVIDTFFDDNINIKKIKEQVYPFSDEYIEHEVIVDTVSDVTVNTTKVIGDYIYIMFKEVSHNINYRGQKYLYDTNNDGIEHTYLCYDKLNPLSLVPEFKAIRCNNQIKWLDKTNGDILQEPVFIGFEITSTNNSIAKEGIIPQRKLVVILQGNKQTKNIGLNDRFILNHKRVFKVTEINDMIMNNINDDSSVTMITMYIEWDSLLPQDNPELNIADYYSNTYRVEINQPDVEQIQNYQGQLTATVKINDKVVDNTQVEWLSANENVVTITQDGIYRLVGAIGSTAQIKCYIDGNESIYDTINVTVVQDYLGEKVIQISPIISVLNELETQQFECGVYINNIKQSDLVVCTPNWAGDNYTLEESIDGYILTNNRKSTMPLILTFSSGSCEPIVMSINLDGLF